MSRLARLRIPAAALAVVLLFTSCGGSSEKGPAVPGLPAGTVADDGFRPVQNGLPFQNYGDALTNGAAPNNMTAADVEKMFGQVVCADAQARKCDLIPEAQAWLDATNEAMAGGHCYGFSVLADLLWQGRLDAASFGAPSVTGLQISGNQLLQRQIAYDWALQTLPSVLSQRISGAPNKVLLALMSALKPGAAQAYTIVFWKRDGSGGHAVTPYAVASRGGGRYAVLIYDNNWPNQTRTISFDANRNTWSYDASTVPGQADSLYEGDAKTKTLALDPASPGLGTQQCPFCGKVPASPTETTAGAGNVAEVSLTGSAANHANLVLSDEAGHRLGYVHGKYVNQIQGAYDAPTVSNDDWDNRALPDFYVPADKTYTLTLDGGRLTGVDDETIHVIGPSFDLVVKGIVMRPGDKDTLVMDPDATRIRYTSSRPESPVITIGVSDLNADYSFELGGLAEKPGGTLNLTLPAEGAALTVETVGSASSLHLKMTRETEQGEQVFQPGPVALASGDKATLQFGRWTDPSQAEPLVIAHGGTTSTLAVESTALPR